MDGSRSNFPIDFTYHFEQHPDSQENVMVFVREFVSEEDIKKYDLDGIWDIYHPFSKGKRPPGFSHSWTIDREREIFFIPVAAGREERSNRMTCVLWWKGTLLAVKIDLAAGSSGNLSDVPFKMVWALVDVHQSDDFVVAREEVIQVLKEALTAYGYRGAKRQVPNTIVEFKF